jgi:hypothetical protein
MLKTKPFVRLPRPTLAAVKWLTLAVVAVPVLLLSMRRAHAPVAPTRDEPVRSIPLTLTGDSGRLVLGWDRGAAAIQAAPCGILWVTDGGIHRRLILDASQLRSGKLFYWPANKDVSFEMKMAEGNGRSGETVCYSNATAPIEPAERPAHPEQRAERTASRSALNKVPMAQRENIESSRSEEVSGDRSAWIESSNAPALTPALTIKGESQLEAALPVPAVQLPVASETPVLSATIRPAPEAAPERYSTVTVEAVAESRLRRFAGKIPLLRKLRRPPEFQPPRPVRENPPTLPADLSRTLKGEVPVDVRAYIDESGKVTYAEMLSDVSDANRRLASLAVFNARRWEFKPAQLEARMVPGEVILHYRFGNPLLSISRDQQ